MTPEERIALVLGEHQWDYEFGCPCGADVTGEDWPEHASAAIVARLDAIPAAPAPPQIRDGIQATRTHQREKS